MIRHAGLSEASTNDPDWDTCSALLRDRLCVPLLLAGAFDSEELHMLNRGQESALQLHAGLQAWLPPGQQVWLHSSLGFGTRFGSFGSSPCGKQFA